MNLFHRKERTRLFGVAVAFAAVSCSDYSAPTTPRAIQPRSGTSKTISDGAHAGNQDVWFLPPMVPNPVGQPGYGNAFASNLSVAIRIKDVTTNTYVVGAPSAVTMSLTDQVYQANWDTKTPVLSLTDIYRVEVQVGGKTIAYADIDVVSAGQLKNVTTGDAIPLVDGRTLPIKVRIEQGVAPCANPSMCTSQTVPQTIPAGTDVKVSTPDLKNWITFHGDGGNWNNQGVAAVVTIEDVSSQFGNTPAGCAQGLTAMVVSGHCVQITTSPAITLKNAAEMCMTLASFDLDWQMLKYNVGEQTKFLADPPALACPPFSSSIGSTQSSNPLVRLASSVGAGLRKLFSPTIAYAFDLGVGGRIDAGDGFSFFAPGRPVTMTAVAGDNQSGLPGVFLPTAPAVQIVKAHHQGEIPTPVGGAIVACQITGGGGSLSTGSGQATEAPTGTYTCPTWKLGSALGTNTLKVTANILDATMPNGSVTFTATAVAPTAIAITPQAGVVDVNQTLAMTAGSAVSWSSSNPAVATIGGTSGIVTGLSVGSVTVIATSASSSSGSASITVDPAGSGTFIGSLGITNTAPVLPSNPSGQWTATIVNPAGVTGGLTLAGSWIQGSNTHGAGGTNLFCPSVGPCTVSFSYATSNIVSGIGPLVPGPATFKLELINIATSAVVDSKTIPVTLVSP